MTNDRAPGILWNGGETAKSQNMVSWQGHGHENRSARKGESLFVIFVGIYRAKRAQNAHYGTFGQKLDISD